MVVTHSDRSSSYNASVARNIKNQLIYDCTQSYVPAACDDACFVDTGAPDIVTRENFFSEDHEVYQTNICNSTDRTIHDSEITFVGGVTILGGLLLFIFLWWLFVDSDYALVQ